MLDLRSTTECTRQYTFENGHAMSLFTLSRIPPLTITMALEDFIRERNTIESYGTVWLSVKSVECKS